MTSPFTAESRPNWEPPRFVVIDTSTGRIASKHKTAEEAKATVESMNARARRN